MNFEMWIMYVYHEICLHHRFYLFRSSNFKTISAVEAVISTTSTPRSCRSVMLFFFYLDIFES